MQKIGLINSLHIFPVAGMSGEQVESMAVELLGVEGNLVLAFTDETNDASSSWMSPKEREQLKQYHAFRVGHEKKNIKVKTPQSEIFDVHDINLLALLIGENNHLLELQNIDPSHSLSLAVMSSTENANIKLTLNSEIKQKHLDQKILTLGQKVKVKAYVTDDLIIGTILLPGIIYPHDPVFLL